MKNLKDLIVEKLVINKNSTTTVNDNNGYQSTLNVYDLFLQALKTLLEQQTDNTYHILLTIYDIKHKTVVGSYNVFKKDRNKLNKIISQQDVQSDMNITFFAINEKEFYDAVYSVGVNQNKFKEALKERNINIKFKK